MSVPEKTLVLSNKSFFSYIRLLASDIASQLYLNLVQVIFASRVLVANIISLLRKQKYHYAAGHNITLCKAQNITNILPPRRFYAIIQLKVGGKMSKACQWKYSQVYSSVRIILIKVITGLLAVVFSFIIHQTKVVSLKTSFERMRFYY